MSLEFRVLLHALVVAGHEHLPEFVVVDASVEVGGAEILTNQVLLGLVDDEAERCPLAFLIGDDTEGVQVVGSDVTVLVHDVDDECSRFAVVERLIARVVTQPRFTDDDAIDGAVSVDVIDGDSSVSGQILEAQCTGVQGALDCHRTGHDCSFGL